MMRTPNLPARPTMNDLDSIVRPWGFAKSTVVGPSLFSQSRPWCERRGWHSRWRLACGGLFALTFSLLVAVGGCSDDHVAPKGDATLLADLAQQRSDGSRDVQAEQTQADQSHADQSAKKCTGSMVLHPATQQCVSTIDIGADCADGKGTCKETCLEGQACVTYKTALGDFCSCAIACGPDPKNVCPDGYQCKWTSDTPKVCSPL